MKVKVFINGYGTIGKRVADAVSLQPDMEVIGVSKTKPDFLAKIAVEQRYEMYTLPENLNKFKERGIDAKPIEEGIKKADIVIDATPKGVGAANKPLYLKLKKNAIFEGGEKAEVADVSFVAQVNYEKALKLLDFIDYKGKEPIIKKALKQEMNKCPQQPYNEPIVSMRDV